jgi:hypothetical protein
MLLFAVLAVMIVALIYEYGFVRRSYKAAETAVDDFVEQRNADSVTTPEVVQARIGKAPTGGLQDKGDYYLEHYKWVRWLPWKSYDIYVVYEHSDPPRLFNTTRPNPPGPTEVPVTAVAYDPPLEGEAGAGQESEGDPAALPARGRRPSAEEAEPAGETGDRAAEAASQDSPSETTPAPAESATESEPAGPAETEPGTSAAPAEGEAGSQAPAKEESESDETKKEDESE